MVITRSNRESLLDWRYGRVPCLQMLQTLDVVQRWLADIHPTKNDFVNILSNIAESDEDARGYQRDTSRTNA
jgi:hypothetical protein